MDLRANCWAGAPAPPQPPASTLPPIAIAAAVHVRIFSSSVEGATLDSRFLLSNRCLRRELALAHAWRGSTFPAIRTVGMALHDVLAAKRDAVMLRWNGQVRGTLAPEAMPPVELANHIPTFVDEIVSALRTDAGLASRGPSPEESATAAGHGAQRLRLGFSLDSVVREYGALRDAIVEVARDAGAEITFRELQVLFDAMVTGIAHAVSEYTHQRDAELLRQANEHFAFIAHELRDPLSSAMMAFNLLKSSGQLPIESRSVGAVERGLQGTSELIDQTLQLARVASGIDLG